MFKGFVRSVAKDALVAGVAEASKTIKVTRNPEYLEATTRPTNTQQHTEPTLSAPVAPGLGSVKVPDLADEPVWHIEDKRAGTANLFLDRVVMLALVTAITASSPTLEKAFVQQKPLNRQDVWSLVTVLGSFMSTVLLQYSGDRKYYTPDGVFGRNKYNR